MGLAASGRVDTATLVTDRLDLCSAPEAFGIAARRTGLKVIIEP
jgi:threonine dehydrogenase-like Zn-dependent dehydrogenase